MFVTMIHHIRDREGFPAAEAKALEVGLPSRVEWLARAQIEAVIGRDLQ